MQWAGRRGIVLDVDEKPVPTAEKIQLWATYAARQMRSLAANPSNKERKASLLKMAEEAEDYLRKVR